MRSSRRRGSAARGIAALSLSLTAAALAPPAQAAVGDLSFADCVANTNVAGCVAAANPALSGAGPVVVSSDGTSAYTASYAGSSVSRFTRAANGTLTFEGCFADANLAGCAVPANAALGGALGVAISPDDESVYVTSLFDYGVSTFTRAPDGALSFDGCFADTNAAGCTVPANAALARASGITVSPDGESVYVASEIDGSVSHFDRLANGALSYVGCYADTNAAGCLVPAQAALAVAQDVAVSPDGNSVYVASTSDDSLTVFQRANNGSLTYQSCFADSPTPGCATATGAPVDGAKGVDVSPDGRSVYVTSQDDSSLSVFDRAEDGSVSFQDCFSNSAPGCAVMPQNALGFAAHVVVSPDNRSVYVTSEGVGAVSEFDRAADGSLTFSHCFADTAALGCEVPASPALDGAFGVGISPDGRSVYVGSFYDASVSHFAREPFRPETEITGGPAEGSIVADDDATFTYTGIPAAETAGFECRLDASASFSSCPIEGVAYANLDDGTHTFEVRALDALGNADLTPAQRTWRIDTTAPPDTSAPETLKGSGPPKKVKTVKRRAKVAFEFSAGEAGAAFECALDAQAFAPCSSPLTTKVKAKRTAKRHRFEVRARDSAGNADASPAVWTFKVRRIDRAGPTPPRSPAP